MPSTRHALHPQFLTNVFYIPYLALRAAPEPIPEDAAAASAAAAASGKLALPPPPPADTPLPDWAPRFGATSLAVGLFSIGWAAVGRPEYGDIAERVSYAVDTFNTNRVRRPNASSGLRTGFVTGFEDRCCGGPRGRVWFALGARKRERGRGSHWTLPLSRHTFIFNARIVSKPALCLVAPRDLVQVFFAFVVDSCLYAVWQAVLLKDAPAGWVGEEQGGRRGS